MKEEEKVMNATEALFGFCAWLSCQRGVLKIGDTSDCAVLVHNIEIFMAANDLPEVRENYTDFLTYPNSEEVKGFEETELVRDDQLTFQKEEPKLTFTFNVLEHAEKFSNTLREVAETINMLRGEVVEKPFALRTKRKPFALRTKRRRKGRTTKEEAIIKRICQMREGEKKTYQEISDQLIAEGVKTLSGRGKWHAQTVHRLYQDYSPNAEPRRPVGLSEDEVVNLVRSKTEEKEPYIGARKTCLGCENVMTQPYIRCLLGCFVIFDDDSRGVRVMKSKFPGLCFAARRKARKKEGGTK